MKFSDAIEEVRKRTNIVDVIGHYVRLKRSGNNYMGLCPFHNENTPSFSVSESKQIWRCFGQCQMGGNVFTFIEKYEGLTFPEAVKFLAKKVNVEIDDDYNYKINDKLRNELYKLYRDVANLYYIILHSDAGKKGLEYFKQRHLTDETIKKFGLGFSLPDKSYVYNILKNKGYDDKILTDSKLFHIYDGKGYDFFQNRVMFPLVNLQDEIVSFQGRILGMGEQKYINTAESIIYHKSNNLFAINFAKTTKRDFYILCEGNMDVITINQAGFENAVASWGTAFTTSQAKIIKRKVKKVYLAQDTDNAGVKAIAAADEICKAEGLETYVIDFSPVKDADEFINKYGKIEFEKKLERPIPTFMFLISKLKTKYDLNNSYEYEKYINEIVKRISQIDSIFLRDKYIKDVALQENIDKDNLSLEVSKATNTNTKIVFEKKEEKKDDFSLMCEKTFVNILLDDPTLAKSVYVYITQNDITDPICKMIYKLILDGYDRHKILMQIENADELYDKEKIKQTITLCPYDNDEKNRKNLLKDLIKKILLNNIEKNKKQDPSLQNILKQQAETTRILKMVINL